MGLQWIGMFKPCKACALGKAKKARVSNAAVPCSIMLFMDISSPSIAGKKHWFLIVEDGMDYTWSNFLKEKSE